MTKIETSATSCNMAKLFVANGYAFGEYWAGYIFTRTLQNPYAFYLAREKMAVLSAQPDVEDGEREIIAAADTFTLEELSVYFPLDFKKTSNIDWLRSVNVLLLCADETKVRLNLLYYTWPAVQLRFVSEIEANTLVIYDRFTPNDALQSLQKEALTKGITAEIERWSMVKLLVMGDRFGELAPHICIETIEKKGKPEINLSPRTS
ncbi:hypothetical protein EZS27_019553 [termite gut metagenome]|uniref:Uncharacterized protein n=1 Tax=termite gut metagenome TaxID=433724 RepID=A0A5J4RE20_9ZZZZ